MQSVAHRANAKPSDLTAPPTRFPAGAFRIRAFVTAPDLGQTHLDEHDVDASTARGGDCSMCSGTGEGQFDTSCSACRGKGYFGRAA